MRNNGKYEAVIKIKKLLVKEKYNMQNTKVDTPLDISNDF